MTGAGAGTLDPDTLTAALLRGARGSAARHAALGLLAEHDYWLRRIAHHHPELVRRDAETGAVLDLDWQLLAVRSATGSLRGSTSQEAILCVALALAVPEFLLDLRSAVTGLGTFHTAAVLRAVAAAAGHPELAPAADQSSDDPGGPDGPAPLEGAQL
ncbi:hypothetical protein [Streptomyces sp. NPDC093223]|uniref:hypothetical protein n=1 Tax=Streptomyces sp. NPDC093223 TaxID=3366033 RepID=UPI0038242B3F